MPAISTRRLASRAALAIRAAIRLAGGREVCFACGLDAEGVVQSARVVSRGNVGSVLALKGFAKRGEMLVHNHPSGFLEPSDADMDIAARVHADGIGFGIVDNAATELYVVVEVPPVVEVRDLDAAKVEGDLGAQGPVAVTLARFEDRPTQRAMAAVVAKLYNDGGVGLLEAGTGVGKSLAYLVPALRWAALNGQRTVVSTNTINLQEQLVGKDLPFLARALSDQKVRFALLKGWRNYLCLLRLEQARSSGASLFEDGMETELVALAKWAGRTTEGSLSDLVAPPRPEVWDEVAAEADLCQRLECPHYEKCFVFKARRDAAQADVIVVNHHLLLSDVAVRRASQNWDEAAVLPAYTRLVVDEGHHLEETAGSHLGATVTRRGLARLFNRLERRGRGLLPALMAKLASSKDLLGTASYDLVADRLLPAVFSARLKSNELFDLLDSLLQQSAGGGTVLRLTDEFATHPIWRAGLRTALDDAVGELVLLEEGLRVVKQRLEGSEKLDADAAPLVNEIRAVTRRLQSAGEALSESLDPRAGAETVRWIEAQGRERSVAVSSVPLDLAPILREDLFRRVTTAIVTSATLTTSGATAPGTGVWGLGTGDFVNDVPRPQSPGPRPGFAFLIGRLGLDDPELEPRTEVFDSPFDFRRQAILVVATDAPAPNVDPAGHMAALVRIVGDTVAASDGGMFVLFTSHRDVRAAAADLRARGVERRWPMLVQGEDSRDAILARFRESGRALLLGTASFWEGVDVPGQALRALVIAKLPFRVPTEPLTAAHCEAIAASGGNPFDEYMLPHALLRLKQGFGRLIRTSEDRGAVIIADQRVVTKKYGRDLLDGLPPAKRVIGKWPDVVREVRAFYQLPA